MKNSVSSFIAELLAGVVLITFASCNNNDNPEPEPVPIITSIHPSSGIIGSPVTITGDQFIPTVPPDQGVGPHPNTSIVAFNGIVAEAPYVYQDGEGIQRINTIVPLGATSGKITVTVNDKTLSSLDDFIINIPIYLPNVEVSTVPGWGLDIAIDSEGSLFLTHNGPNEIIKITPDGIAHTLWSSGTDTPFGIAVDTQGNVFVTIVNSHIIKIDVNGNVTTLAGSTVAGDVNGQGANARFRIPLGIDVDKDGNLYVADVLNYKIRKITPNGTVSTLAGSTYGHKDGTGANAQFLSPDNVFVDADGNVYVSDAARIRKVTSDGQVSTVAGSVHGYRDGTIANAEFGNINGMVKDAAGNLYLADEGNYVVRRIAPDGTVVTVAGSTFGYLDGPGSTALFSQPLGMTMDASGHILLTQGGGLYKIRRITIN
ncbi:MAG: IPT/TIG domain-containing protein, partial [Chitinophagales bacterium]